jgi:cell division transport system permease protein
MFVSSVRVTKFAFKSFWRNIWLSIATVSVIILTLISVSFLGFLNIITSESVESVKERIDISVYFKPEVTPHEVKGIQEKLSTFREVKNIKYVSREDSLNLLKETYKDDVLVIESLEELGVNPLGDTLIIKAHDLSHYPVILDLLDRSQYRGLIEDKDYKDNQSFLNKIYTVTGKIKRFGLIASIVFASIAILVVFNTLRIAIYTHSEEISIMKLVGASNAFIRAPFLIEAVLYAAIGTVLTLLLLYPMLTLIDPYIISFFEGTFSLTAFYMSNIVVFGSYQFVGILTLTMLASFLAVGRYLDV